MSRSTEFQRSLDRYAGAVAAFGLALRRPTSMELLAPARIGVIQPSALGDLIIASGLIAHIRAVYPSAEIHVLHGASNAAAMQVLDRNLIGHQLDFTRPFRTLRNIRSLNLDALIDLVPWSHATALICRLAGAKMTFGFAVPGLYRHLLFARTAQYSPDLHQSANFKALASLFGRVDRYAYALRQPFPKPELKLPYDRLIICHMRPGGSQAAAKSWPADRWIELARRLCDDSYVVAFSGSIADRHEVQKIAAAVERDNQQCFSVAGDLNLAEFAYVLQHARLAISVDTSPLHLASAVGLPVIGLHGPTRSQQWGVISPHARSIDAAHLAAGYMQFGFETHQRGHEIMAAISVEQVYQAAMALLAQVPQTAGACR